MADIHAIDVYLTQPPVLAVDVYVAQGPAGVGIIAGGTAGQVLSKIDGTDYNTEWATVVGGGAGVSSVNTRTGAVVLDATDVDLNKAEIDADHIKLATVETGATADQTGAEIKAAYEAQPNTNAFTDAEKTNLSNQSNTNTGDQDLSGLFALDQTTPQTVINGVPTFNGGISGYVKDFGGVLAVDPSSRTLSDISGSTVVTWSTGSMIVTGSISGTNLSGTNTGDQDLSGLALKSNVLEKDNATSYTPTADYHPSTKDYADGRIANYTAIQTLTDAATIINDASQGAVAQVTLTADRTLAAITNATAGQSGTLYVIQGTAGGWGLTKDASQTDRLGTLADLTGVAAGEHSVIAWSTRDAVNFDLFITP